MIKDVILINIIVYHGAINIANNCLREQSILFIDENCSKPTKSNYITNQTNVYHFDDTCSLDILDQKDYGSEKNKGYSYVLVVIDNFSNFGWTIPLKNKNAQTIKHSFENFLTTLKRKPNLVETDVDQIFQLTCLVISPTLIALEEFLEIHP